MATKAKELIERRVEKVNEPVKLTKDMSIADMIRAMAPEIKNALPSVLTPERFTRMALSALNNTPQLRECTPMSFIAALLNAAQLGLEPNTPLGQAYLIPYKNKGVLECQFQLGYKGLISLKRLYFCKESDTLVPAEYSVLIPTELHSAMPQ